MWNREPVGWITWALLLLFSIVVTLWTTISSLMRSFLPWKGPRTQSHALILPYGRQPRFFDGSYTQAFSKAREENKFLLVYLHSSLHSDSPRFCRDVLCTDRVAYFLEENFVIWGGDVFQQEASNLSTKFGATTYPFLAVITNFTSSSSFNAYLLSLNYTERWARSGTILLFKSQGYIPQENLLRDLTDTLETHGALLLAAKAEKEDREQDRTLVERQDKEFQESLQRDREREQMKMEEENRKRLEEEAERRFQMEFAEKRKREFLELEERGKREEMERIERERRQEEQAKQALKILPAEPEKSSQTTELAIRLTDGSRIRRRFLVTDPLEYVFMLVATKEDIGNKVLATHYPKKIYSEKGMTLLEAGLVPQAAVFVEEIPMYHPTTESRDTVVNE